jgi:hypothetical protein
MMEWEETENISDGLVITFEGINQDAQDALDMENFARGLKTPAKEDPGGKAFARTASARSRAMTPMDGVRLGLGLLFGIAAFLTAGALKLSDGVWFGACAVAALAGYLVPDAVMAMRRRQAQPVARTTAESFRISLSPTELVVEGQAAGRKVIRVAEIDRFDGRGRLTMMRRDGGAVVLPCSLRSRSHGELARRLDELLGQARSRG